MSVARITGHASRATPLGLAAALVSPALVTLALAHLQDQPRDYVFIYLGIVAVLGVTTGIGPAILGAGLSFVLVDYFFVSPIHDYKIADSTDLVNLVVFFAAAGVVGGLGSRQRRVQLRASALAGELQSANIELGRLNREQAEAATISARLLRTEQQVQVLEETDRLRGELLGNVSHELRTPLANILMTGSTALLASTSDSEQTRNALGTMVGDARRLERLVSDMLDMTRIEGDALHLRVIEVDLGEAVEMAVQRVLRSSPARAIAVDSAAGRPIEVRADWDRLGQILDNLLANADRHAPPSTPIDVSITTARLEATVRVIDHGPGVPPELRPKVFERFVRDDADPPGRRDGTGLGLAIVRGLVQAHGGRVWLEEPVADQGGRFAFTLPLAASPAEAAVTPAETEGAASESRLR